MIGLLQEKSEIEKLQREYKILSELNFNIDTDLISKVTIPEEELILEECEY
ncbi:hypothetical protein SAMN05443667_101687 [Flavobacterium gillisiae]|uniref:Uncharacterized protein n=1 Tax=Flavobacterium gillisiae TaxID=150146 RepID=A0A1H3XVE9_9FLAO|nr:hypothetical protein [Flavobacterium gillisiae]SEA03447.1 hypothetical protein SAMN05443667_101687 [Flavobacterium gillisiae]